MNMETHLGGSIKGGAGGAEGKGQASARPPSRDTARKHLGKAVKAAARGRKGRPGTGKTVTCPKQEGSGAVPDAEFPSRPEENNSQSA